MDSSIKYKILKILKSHRLLINMVTFNQKIKEVLLKDVETLISIINKE